MANSKLRSWGLRNEPKFAELSSFEPLTLKSDCVVGQGNHLCRITPCDWNGDGVQDFLVAEIGSMIISDQKLGDVALYLGEPNNTFRRLVLASS